MFITLATIWLLLPTYVILFLYYFCEIVIYASILNMQTLILFKKKLDFMHSVNSLRLYIIKFIKFTFSYQIDIYKYYLFEYRVVCVRFYKQKAYVYLPG